MCNCWIEAICVLFATVMPAPSVAAATGWPTAQTTARNSTGSPVTESSAPPSRLPSQQKAQRLADMWWPPGTN